MGLRARNVIIQQRRNETNGVESLVTVVLDASTETEKLTTAAAKNAFIGSLRFRLGTSKYYVKDALVRKSFKDPDSVAGVIGFEIQGRKVEIN